MEVALVFNIILPLVAAVTTAFGTVLALNETMNRRERERMRGRSMDWKKAEIPPR